MKKTNSLILWFYTLKFVEWGNKIETDIENREAKLLLLAVFINFGELQLH